MAFSDAEKAAILAALGRSVFEDDGPAMRAINSLDSYETKARPVIDPIMVELAKIDLQISKSKLRAVATQDGSTRIDAGRELGVLRSHGRQAVGRLSRWLKVPVLPEHDIYSGSAPTDFDYDAVPGRSYTAT